MSLQTPLSKAQGLGSSKTGFHHWWLQRMTSIILAPLALWLGFSLASLSDLSHQAMVNWFNQPLIALLMLLLIIVSYYHMALGLRVIMEDYVHVHWVKVSGIISINIGSLLLGIIGSLSVLKLFL